MRSRKAEAAREGRQRAQLLERFASQMMKEGRALFAQDLRACADHFEIMANMLDPR